MFAVELFFRFWKVFPKEWGKQRRQQISWRWGRFGSSSRAAFVRPLLSVPLQCMTDLLSLSRWKYQRARISRKGRAGHKRWRGRKKKRRKKGRITLVDALSGVNYGQNYTDNGLFFKLSMHLIKMHNTQTLIIWNMCTNMLASEIFKSKIWASNSPYFGIILSHKWLLRSIILF